MTKRRACMMALMGSLLIAGGALLAYPQAARSGISRGLSVCAGVLIPSLFPFLVLGGFLTESGVANALGKRLERITTRLFGLPGCCAVAILIGALGGYPAGGAVTAELLRSRQIDTDEGRRLLRFCVNGGPGFVIGTVGAGLMGSTAFGVLLLTAHLTASFLMGVIGAPRGSRRQPPRSRRTMVSAPPAVALVESVRTACETLLYMCGFVLLFAAVLAVVDACGVVAILGGGTVRGERTVSALIACVLEVSCGCTAAAALQEAAPLLLGFAVGFGGLSVHCQLASALRGFGVLDGRFFMARLAHGGLTALLTQMLLRAVPIARPVAGSLVKPIAQASSESAVCSAALLVTVGIWMLTLPLRLDKEKRLPYNKITTEGKGEKQ